MLKILFTVDTEVWCGDWNNLDAAFPHAFNSYVYGPTPQGDYALPGLFRILNEHGLKAVFMLESLFSTRFGHAPLEEMVGLINEAGHEIQLHLHPEWVDEAPEPLIAPMGKKCPLMSQYSLADQRVLIATGLDLLRAAGAAEICAFRAGSYGINLDSLTALRDNAIRIDTSYNPAYSSAVDNVTPGRQLTQPEEVEGVSVFPVTGYRDRGDQHLRHMQLTACSFHEMRRVLEQAEKADYEYVVMVAHNFELLTPDKRRVDRLVVRRFERLCRYLADNTDRYQVCGFNDIDHINYAAQPQPVAGSILHTAGRHAEQLARRFI